MNDKEVKNLAYAFMFGKVLTTEEDILSNSRFRFMLSEARQLYDPPFKEPIIIEEKKHE